MTTICSTFWRIIFVLNIRVYNNIVHASVTNNEMRIIVSVRCNMSCNPFSKNCIIRFSLMQAVGYNDLKRQFPLPRIFIIDFSGKLKFSVASLVFSLKLLPSFFLFLCLFVVLIDCSENLSSVEIFSRIISTRRRFFLLVASRLSVIVARFFLIHSFSLVYQDFIVS
ncbi:hypothetical protein PGB90_002041 [Kerria lacca]